MSDEPSPFLPEEGSAPDEPTPWGFRIVLAAAVLYLGWRLVQGILWLWEALVG